ncbi:SHOCT domain-containing protein [Empedobacter sp. GD03797]|uniref:SHOCT domain-containing protein n=1 Tax=Empedobacter sp. GD03797 TaxID=2975382 RepID=UPI00244BA7AE|nr:SHOCT domain-containing protein [Empedobacter sp. GD03797]MDH1883946.1 SHOCT domain-containing protein [Empedobacter sp. GD03797]
MEIFTATGRSGSVELFEDRVIIKKRFGGLQRKFISGDIEIYLDSIKNLNFKNANSLTYGFIQFETAENSKKLSKGSLMMGPTDEFSVIFTKSQQNEFDNLKSKINQLRNKPKSVIQETSSADELLKFAELRDKGIITNDEFEVKKKQLLGL